MTSPSVWAPGTALDANRSVKAEYFAATAAQTLFTLTHFSYMVGTGSLLVFRNGLALRPGFDFYETSQGSFTLANAAALNDIILAIGFVEVSANLEETLVVTDKVIAAVGQTLIPISGWTYTPGGSHLRVFKNGHLLTLGTDYTETNDHSFTLTAPAAGGEVIISISNIFVTPDPTLTLRADLLSYSGSALVGYSPLVGGIGTRTVQEKLREHVSLFDFLSLADITAYQTNTYPDEATKTRMTAALQAAIAYAGSDPGEVFLPPGTAKVNSGSLTMYSNRKIWGNGVIDIGTGYIAATNGLFIADGKSNWSVDGITFRSDQRLTDQVAFHLKDTATPCSNVRVTNCQFYNIKAMTCEQGLHADGSGPYVYHYYVGNQAAWHNGIYFTGNYHWADTAIAAEAIESETLRLFWCRNVVCTDNVVENAYGLFFAFNGAPNDPNWLLSYCGDTNMVVSNNNMENCCGNGIVIIGAKNFVVSGNTISGDGGEVLDLEGCDDAVVIGNRVTTEVQGCKQFWSCGNIMWIGNYMKCTLAGTINIPFTISSTFGVDPDQVHGGNTWLIGNTFESYPQGGAQANYIALNTVKGIIIEDNTFINTGLFIAKCNEFRFNRNIQRYDCPAGNRLPIEIAEMGLYGWLTGIGRPKIEIDGNKLHYTGANYNGTWAYIGAFAVPGDVSITNNETHTTNGYMLRFATAGGVARYCHITGNKFANGGNSGVLEHGAPVNTTRILWRDNFDEYGLGDALGGGAMPGNGITGTAWIDITSATCIPVLEGGSRLSKNALGGAGVPVGYVLDNTGGVWRGFGVTL